MKNITLIILCFCFIFKINAQNIDGKVIEITSTGTNEPVFKANVYWEGTNVGTSTNIDGIFSIQEPPTLPATLNVSYIGYKLVDKEIINNEYIFYLEKNIDLEEVDIRSKKKTTSISIVNPINVQNISRGEIVKAACCNLSECFETNASVDVTYSDAISGLKKINMLGLDGLYIQINNESLPLVNGLLNSYGLSYVPGSWIESIQIIKGSGSVVNGYSACIGQINVEYFKPENASKLFWNFYTHDGGKIENNVLISKKKGNWKSNLFTHISYFDREKDNHGHYHDQNDHANDKADGFIDAPRIKQFNVLNRWVYSGFDDFRMQIYLKGMYEDRVGGQKQSIPNYYLAEIHNDLLELNTKTAYINPNDINKNIGLQTIFRMHNQKAQFGINNYTGFHEKAYLNFIVNNYFNNINNKIKYGVSYNADRFTESFNGNTLQFFDQKTRVDLVTGIFSEYNYSSSEIFNLNLGLRLDYYNITENIYFTPRSNFKFNPSEKTVIRLSYGDGFRIANILVDNLYHLASSREVIFEDNLLPEKTNNYGANFSYCFYLLNREAVFNFDLYRTNFENKIVVDLEDQTKLSFYNLNGKAYANSIQFDFAYELFNRLDFKISYKNNTSYTTYNDALKITSLMPKERALLNLAYATNLEKWKFDFTSNYIGSSRIPKHNYIDVSNNFSNPFIIYNSQITRKLNKYEAYIGVENISDYTQKNPIIDSENPFGENFDASLIYAPVMGRMFYLGLRLSIDN